MLVLVSLLSACGAENQYPDWTPEIDFEPPADYQITIFEAQDPEPASEARLADPRPNIIFALTDDQPPQRVAYMPTVKNVLMAEGGQLRERLPDHALVLSRPRQHPERRVRPQPQSLYQPLPDGLREKSSMMFPPWRSGCERLATAPAISVST